MRIEDQVCNLTLAKQLINLGLKRDSFFVWTESEDEWKLVQKVDYVDSNIPCFPAYTVAELGELMGASKFTSASMYSMKKSNASQRWIGGSLSIDLYETKCYIENRVSSRTEADTRAKIIIRDLKRPHADMYLQDMRYFI